MPAVVLSVTLCPMPCYIRDAVEDKFLASICVSFRWLRYAGHVIRQYSLYACPFVPFVVLVCWSVRFFVVVGSVWCLRQAGGVTCSRFSKVPHLVPHAILRLRPQWPVLGRLGVVLPCRIPARLQPHFREQGTHYERPLFSYPSSPSLSLVLTFPFARYEWDLSSTFLLVPHVKLRLRS